MRIPWLVLAIPCGVLSACTPGAGSPVTNPTDLPPSSPTAPALIPNTPSAPTGSEPGFTPCAALTSVERAYVPQGDDLADAVPACTVAVHPIAGASGSVLSVVVDASVPVRVSAVDPAGRLAADTSDPLGALSVALDVSPVVSGEVLVSIAPVAPTADQGDLAYTVSVQCVDGCERLYTRYPVLLMHGMGGASDFGGVDYFYRVPGELSAAGVVVDAPAVSPFADSTQRAAEWAPHLDALLAQGHRRVNVIAHSQGGLDARVLASPGGLDRGDDIASITTIGTPHAGSDLADVLDGLFTGGVVDPAVVDLGAALFEALFGLPVDDPQLAAAIHQFTSAETAALDAVTPDHPATGYGSWAGHSCGVLEPGCQADHGGEVVDGTLAASYLLIWPKPNDGMVPVTSQQYGAFLGELDADHADEIGQFSDALNPAFDHLAFYFSEVDRLRGLGL